MRCEREIVGENLKKEKTSERNNKKKNVRRKFCEIVRKKQTWEKM
jgi:hypothetical protein